MTGVRGNRPVSPARKSVCFVIIYVESGHESEL